jgi:hypothetical protein
MLCKKIIKWEGKGTNNKNNNNNNKMSKYRAICVSHYWHHRDHVDDAYIVGEYNTQKEAFEHAVCWEIAENYDSDKNLGKYGELLPRLTKLNFDSIEEVQKFVEDWKDARHKFLYDDSLGCTSGSFVSITQMNENLKIFEESVPESWYKLMLGKKDEAINFFKDCYLDGEVTEYIFEFLKELGLPEDILDTLSY